MLVASFLKSCLMVSVPRLRSFNAACSNLPQRNESEHLFIANSRWAFGMALTLKKAGRHARRGGAEI
jgi:hypothetical protein